MSTQNTTETTCHCAAPFNGSDHCAECGCEQYERFCNHTWASAEVATTVCDVVNNHTGWSVTRTGGQMGEAMNQFSFEAEGRTFTVTVQED